jgi:hypothetical protein
VGDYNRAVAESTPVVDAYNSAYAERAYYEDDLAAVLAER